MTYFELYLANETCDIFVPYDLSQEQFDVLLDIIQLFCYVLDFWNNKINGDYVKEKWPRTPPQEYIIVQSRFNFLFI